MGFFLCKTKRKKSMSLTALLLWLWCHHSVELLQCRQSMQRQSQLVRCPDFRKVTQMRHLGQQKVVACLGHANWHISFLASLFQKMMREDRGNNSLFAHNIKRHKTHLLRNSIFGESHSLPDSLASVVIPGHWCGDSITVLFLCIQHILCCNDLFNISDSSYSSCTVAHQTK